jgi:hypothetical protein
LPFRKRYYCNGCIFTHLFLLQFGFRSRVGLAELCWCVLVCFAFGSFTGFRSSLFCIPLCVGFLSFYYPYGLLFTLCVVARSGFTP